ncbi:MAG TPA: hypothetical protein VFS43_10265 [Polyangiaceae bacterium]|nr:hypothetical protein [Polyangiaceae bacterium]
MKARTLLTFLGVVVASGCFGAGCGDDDDDTNPGGAGQGQAGASAGGASGTGGGGQAGAGAAGAGAAGAGAAGAGGSRRQRVVVRESAEPVEGVDVLAHDGGGALRARTTTGADGAASVEVPAGGSVTVAYAGDDDKVVSTHYGLDGSFDLDVDFGGGGGSVGVTPMRVRVTPSAPGLQPSAYGVALSCDDLFSLTAPGGVNDRPGFTGCGGGAYDVLVVAIDKAGVPLAYGTVVGAPFQPGVEAKHAVVVDQTDFIEHKFAVQGAPAGFAPTAAFPSAVRGGWSFFDLPETSGGGDGSSGTFWVPNGFFEKVSFGQSVAQTLEGGLRRLLSYRKNAAGSTLGAIAWPANVMALIDSVTPDFDTDPARPSVAWQVAVAGGLGDMLSVRTGWLTPGGELRWQVFAPPARAGGVRLVELPEDLSGYAPGAGAELDFVHTALFDVLGTESAADFYRQVAFPAEMLISVAEYPVSSVGPVGAPRAPAESTGPRRLGGDLSVDGGGRRPPLAGRRRERQLR